VAERSAGIADDLVLGFDEMVVSRQFKTSKLPGTFTVETMVVKAIPSVTDKLGDAAHPHCAAFLDDVERFADRALQEWWVSGWSRLVDLLHPVGAHWASSWFTACV